MKRESGAIDRLRSILVMLATVATIAFNGLAASGYVNGVMPTEISDKYSTIVTPASYAFSIWSLIYFGLATFSIFQLMPANLARFRGVRSLFIASCLLNVGWIYFWHQDRVGVCLILIAALLAILIVIATRCRSSKNTLESWIVKGTFGLYAGWVAIAAVVNLFVYLAASGVASAASPMFGVAAVIFATAIAVLAAWRISNYFFPLAVAWALTAIAIEQSGKTAVVVACAFGVIVCLVASLSFVLKLPMMAISSEKDE